MNACGRGAHCALEREGAPLFLVIALVAALLVVGAMAAPSAGAHVVAPASTEQTARFWTAARMRQARPLDLPRPGRGSVTLDGPAAAGEAPRIHPPSAAGDASASSSFETVPGPDCRNHPGKRRDLHRDALRVRPLLRDLGQRPELQRRLHRRPLRQQRWSRGDLDGLSLGFRARLSLRPAAVRRLSRQVDRHDPAVAHDRQRELRRRRRGRHPQPARRATWPRRSGAPGLPSD